VGLLRNFPAGRIAIALLVIIATILLVTLAQGNALFVFFIVMVVVGVTLSIIAWMIVLKAALYEDGNTALLVIFVPYDGLFYAFTRYVGDYKFLVLLGWMAGPVIALIGGLILLFNNTLWEWVYY
jgi:hypothetical protein